MTLAELHPYFLVWTKGLAAGFIASMPVGPINITILHEGAKRGFRWGLLIGLGAVAMDTIYCTLGFAGFSSLLESAMIQAAMQLASFSLVLYLGLKYALAKALPSTPKTVAEIEERLHPHTAFTTGFARVLGNPAVLLFWAMMAGAFLSHDLVAHTWPSKFACISGVASGASTWFVLLSYAVSLGHKKFTDQALLRLSRICGLFLLSFAATIGFRIVLLLLRAHNKT